MTSLGSVHGPRSFRRRPTRGFPGPHFVPSSGALSLSTVFLRSRARGLVSSRSHVQDPSCSGAFSLRAAVPVRHRPYFAPLPLSAEPLTDRPVPMIRRLGFEALLRAGAALSPGELFTRRALAPLFRFCAPPGCSLSAPPGLAYRARSAHDVSTSSASS
jgi:hypothetical protein